MKIALLPGDGIGPEVAAAAADVLRELPLELELEEHLFGGAAIHATGDPLPAETLAAARASDAVLMGAVGLVLQGRGIARHGYAIHGPGADEQMGVVTSGAPSPTLGVPIAMAYVPPTESALGTMVEVAIRAARAEAEVVPLPFYKRAA